MNLQYKVALVSLVIHGVSLVVRFDTIQCVLLVVYCVFMLWNVFSGTSQTVNVFWLFAALIAIAYGIFYAYTTVPRMGSDPLYLFLSIMKLAGALVGIIATAFSLELKYS